MSVPPWNWLPSRKSHDQNPPDGAPAPLPSRPCLPAVEALGDRVLLSAAPGAASNGPPPADQVLIGLLKGELSLVNQQLAALKLAADADPQTLHKLTDGFLKVDDVLVKYGEAFIKGDLNDQKIKLSLYELERQLIKLGTLKFPTAQMQPALDGIKLGAENLIDAINQVGSVGDLSQKQQLSYLKINDAFGAVDAALLKIEGAVIENKVKADQKVDYLVIKLNDVLVSSVNKVDDPDLQKSLQGLVAETDRILIGLLQPPQTDDVIG
jgi:hypothetical protein